MSLRTRINGFTAWVNLRLTPYNHLLNNVLMDLLSGTHMRYFVESFTGKDFKRLDNMDGLSEQQKQTRIDWMVEELKKSNVIPDDVFVDTRQFAMRNADHVFDLLWRLISHDIWFVWERMEYLQIEDLDVLTQVPFKWTPEPPPRKKKTKVKAKKSLLSGFGASSVQEDRTDEREKSIDIRSDSAVDHSVKNGRSKAGDRSRANHTEDLIDQHSKMPMCMEGKTGDIVEGEAEIERKETEKDMKMIEEEIQKITDGKVNTRSVEPTINKKILKTNQCAENERREDNQEPNEEEVDNELEEIATTKEQHPPRNMVSIYIVPLKQPEDGSDEDCYTQSEISCRSSPWPFELEDYLTTDEEFEGDEYGLEIAEYLKDGGIDKDAVEAQEKEQDTVLEHYSASGKISSGFVRVSVRLEHEDMAESTFYPSQNNSIKKQGEKQAKAEAKTKGKLGSSESVKIQDNDRKMVRPTHHINTESIWVNKDHSEERDTISDEERRYGFEEMRQTIYKSDSEKNLLKLSLQESVKLSDGQLQEASSDTVSAWVENNDGNQQEKGNYAIHYASMSSKATLFEKSPRLQGNVPKMKREVKREGFIDSLKKGDNSMLNIEEFSSPVWRKRTLKSQSLPVTRRGSVASNSSHASTKRPASRWSNVSSRSDVTSRSTFISRSSRRSKVTTRKAKCSNVSYEGVPKIRTQLKSTSMPNLPTTPKEDDEKWIRFPNADYMKGFKKRKYEKENYPSPDGCILDMINYQLKSTRDGKGIFCYSIDDFVDSRVLCALVNSFVPNTFTADLLLNDRWTINLALKTAEKMFYAETPFDAEDLAEADPMAVSAYFAFFLMVAYRYRQTTAVVNRVDFINMLIRECNHELEKFPAIIEHMAEAARRKELKQQLDQHRQAIEKIQRKFDIEFCRKWVQHVEHVQNELRREIRDKMRMRFEIVEIPRNISINEFCLAAVINLTLTNGSGFYFTTGKELLSEGRKLVLRRKETNEFIEDFTNKSKATIRETLKLPDIPGQVIEINPEDYPAFEFYFEAPSRNKTLKTGGYFLYQVFPGNTMTWQRLFIKSARDNELETVQKMIAFFREEPSFINSKEAKSGNTALHWACRMGHFDVARLLLENGANVDVKNYYKCAPINLAIEALQRRVCHYLIEWGCDVHTKNVKGQTVLETIKNDDFKRYAFSLYDYYSDIVPRVMNGDMELLNKVIKDHVSGAHEFCCLRSRCINGSTLLHTACYYGNLSAMKELLSLRVDINIRDYKGATPLHRARDPDVMELLLDAGAHVNAEDSESNTPLHVKCYGETHKASELECIEMLLNRCASLIIRNSRGLMPIHCCVMQGRIDVMKMLMTHDKSNSMLSELSKENNRKPPSLCHLAIANDFPDCAEWLVANGFQFKEKEQDILMRRILTEQIKLTKRAECIKFLLDNGADPSPKYPGGNTALHYAAGLSGPSDVLEILVSYKAEIDEINDEGCTPLFFATQSNNKFAACVLIEHSANVRQKNAQGFTALDYIVDFEEWIECGYFSEEIKARLKAYNLKHARDLIRAISKRVKPNPLLFMRPDFGRTALLPSTGMSTQHRTGTSGSSMGGSLLPPVFGQRSIMF